MTTIKLPNEVAQELLLAANKNNQTVNDHIIFLQKGDCHPRKILPAGDCHSETQTVFSTIKHNPKKTG